MTFFRAAWRIAAWECPTRGEDGVEPLLDQVPEGYTNTRENAEMMLRMPSAMRLPETEGTSNWPLQRGFISQCNPFDSEHVLGNGLQWLAIKADAIGVGVARNEKNVRTSDTLNRTTL